MFYYVLELSNNFSFPFPPAFRVGDLARFRIGSGVKPARRQPVLRTVSARRAEAPGLPEELLQLPPAPRYRRSSRVPPGTGKFGARGCAATYPARSRGTAAGAAPSPLRSVPHTRPPAGSGAAGGILPQIGRAHV